MKQLLTFVALVFTVFVNGQSVSLAPTLQTQNIHGNQISKGDTVQIALKYTAPGNNSNPTSFYFDFQHQYVGYTLANVTFPAAGVNGSSLPSGTSTSYSNNYYPGYSYTRTAQNYTTNGLTNANYANYYYNTTYGTAIDRISISYSAPSNAPLVSGTMAFLNFIPTTTMPAGYAYDSLYLDFVYGYTSAGNQVAVYEPKPSSTFIQVSSTSNALINGNLRLNSNLPSQYAPVVIFADSATGQQVASFSPAATTGKFTVASEVLPNHTYKVYIQTPGAQAWQLMSNTVTVSDYTAALNEFMHQNLDGTYTQTNIHTGVGYLASDVNFNGKFDGGDLAVLFDAACGNDSTTIITNGAMSGINGNPVMPVFVTSVYDTLGINAWQSHVSPNNNFIYYHTGTIAQSLNLAYVIPGDITRTFSSPVIQNGSVAVDASIKNQSAPTSVRTFGLVNQVASSNAINVDISNVTVTSDDITVPIKLNTNGLNLSALQFTFVYDSTKIKFNQLSSNVPNQWVTIVGANNGVIKFTTIDKQLKYPLTGTSVPFTLNFKSVGSGLDLNTLIQVLSNMDAADKDGNQVGINLNTTNIKLTGYNNF